MPTAHNDGVALTYAAEGAGPTIAFCSTVGLGAWQWSYLLGGLPGTVETLVWNYRGTGDSDAPGGSYSIPTLVEDLDAVLGEHGARSVHLVGAGLGGQVAIEYARRSGRVQTLTLFGTPMGPDDIDADALDRLQAPRDDAQALRQSLQAAFAAETVEQYGEEMDRIVGWRREDDADSTGWAGQCAAFTEWTLESLYEVTTDTLVCHGVADAIVDPEAGERLAAELPRARHVAVDGGHCCYVESAQAVTDELLGVLEESGAFE